ncbi:phage tail tape measure protein [Pseudomonas citronellolis]|uniref:phage tail tape measure protein n=1 Tax=Pseudomonas citronellolis TaxID=53408 RepID=UPI00209D6B5F|nr:phage tail tape measure protein [Pseudomonas citronellolis]MCP1605734.1 TP901 family phage tail tape measure protein [Pseudomonas citronellolis]MCP1656111.1 TP901 family phage tail tape measure protein [Pseudomonas citronellolis]MCP1722271.1 TP901 family phage tail tape measure protein [Pseudomonas citronellolis]
MANDLQLRVLLNVIDKALGPLKKITQGSGETAKALKAARERLKALNAAQADTSAWRTQNAALGETSAALKAASQKLAELRRSSDASTREVERARRETQRLGELYSRQKHQLEAVSARLSEAGIKTQRLGAEELRLQRNIQAATKAIEAQKAKLTALASARSTYDKTQAFAGKAAIVGAGATAAGAAVGLPVVGLVKTYSSFEDAMLGVAKQVDGARDANGQLTSTYYEMADAIQAMSKRIPMATTDLAALVEGGARMGVQGKENLLAFTETAANAATAFELPADQIGEDLARIADLFKVPIKNVSQLGDAINYLDDNAKSKGADIIEVLQRTAGITASVGMSYRDAAALGSTFLTLGSSAEVAGTATNAMIRELAIASQQPKKFQQGLKALGLQAESIQNGMAKNSTATILKVLDALNKLPKNRQLSVTTQLFGKEYGDDAAKLAANISEYRRQLELANSEAGKGSMQREADIRSNTISARWQMLQNRLFNTEANSGAGLRGMVMGLIDSIGNLIDKVDSWVKANPALAKGLLIAAAAVSGLLTAFGGLTLAMAAAIGPFAVLRYGMALFGIQAAPLLGMLRGLVGLLMGPLVAGIRMVSVALWGLAANPLVLAIAAVVAVLAGAAYLIYTNWDQVKAYLLGMWAEIKAGFDAGFGGIITVLANFNPLGLVYRAFAELARYLGFDLPLQFTEFGNMIVRGLINGLLAGLGQIKSAISTIGESTIGWFKEKLGIHSPSRVFAELGGFTMAGLQQGLVAGQSGPLGAISDLGKRLAAAGALVLGGAAPAVAIDNRPPISAAVAPAVIQGDTYNITIQAAPGTDTAALRRMLEQMLDERERGKAARMRSRLGDRE